MTTLTDKARAMGLATMVVALCAACTVTGDPVAHYPDPAALDTGPYSGEPFEVPDGSDAHGRVLESVRLAEAMMDPVEADPTLTHAAGLSTVVSLPTPAKAAMLLSDPVRSVLERHGMLAGSAVSGTDRTYDRFPEAGQSRILSVIVLRFPDADAAARAAVEIDAVDAAVSAENVPVTIADHPAARAHWRPAVPTLAATLAHDVFAVSVLAGHTSADLPLLSELARKAFDAQVKRLDDFVPTPRDQLAALPLDPHDMIRRMVPDAPGRWPYPAVIVTSEQLNAGWNSVILDVGVAYGPRGTWLWGGRKNSENAPESVAYNGFNGLFRYPSIATARRVFDRKDEKMADESARVVPAPAGVPDAQCWEFSEHDFWGMTRYTCWVLYGRYVAAVLARDLTNVQQKTAAQYGLLVNSDQ
ncbi:hypothetical protein [Nocardia sp. NPDC127526]|uniref:DUF7373 family lipoprotein n=1 Tax=Nocardia sp. NPDC127526 TaxID=3345393 RepID=UPI0036436005